MKISGLVLVRTESPNLLVVSRPDGTVDKLAASDKVLRFVDTRRLVGSRVALYINEGGTQVGLVGRIEPDTSSGQAAVPAQVNPAAADILADLSRKLAGD